MDSLKEKLRALGIDLTGAKNATLRDLVSELPPTLVAQTLGYSPHVIHLHAAHAASPMAGYVSMNPIAAGTPSDIQSARGQETPVIQEVSNAEARTQADPAVGLAAIREASSDLRLARLRLDDGVLHARSLGLSWAKVATALGISSQAANQRWSKME